MITLADFLLGLGNLHGLVFSFSDFVSMFIQKNSVILHLVMSRGCLRTEKDNLLDADLADGADYLFMKSAKSALSASKE